jgi:His-Xaa-Ser system protein HxsD
MKGISKTADGYSLMFDTSVYSLEAIKKSAYKFADRTSVVISRTSETSVSLAFNFVDQKATDRAEQIISDFCNELLDQDLREIVKRETGALRNAIIAHAFSRTPLADRQ